ncbi:MAG: hypothetical protein Q4B26_12085 [Eubacteriales bacterium]|nr:hypothetical protein [Eubacteriales bacterium]
MAEIIVTIIVFAIVFGTGYMIGIVYSEDHQLDDYEREYLLDERRKARDEEEVEEQEWLASIIEHDEQVEARRAVRDQKRLAKEVRRIRSESRESRNGTED